MIISRDVNKAQNVQLVDVDVDVNNPQKHEDNQAGNKPRKLKVKVKPKSKPKPESESEQPVEIEVDTVGNSNNLPENNSERGRFDPGQGIATSDRFQAFTVGEIERPFAQLNKQPPPIPDITLTAVEKEANNIGLAY
jgi:hypothetical protein